MSYYTNIWDFANVSKTDDKYAQKTQAGITRAMWDDYKNTYLPKLEELAYLGSRDGQEQMTNELIGGIKDSYNGFADQSADRSNRSMQRFGLSPTAQESSSNTRKSALTAAAGLSRDTYDARIDAANRVEGLLTGGALSKEGLVKQ